MAISGKYRQRKQCQEIATALAGLAMTRGELVAGCGVLTSPVIARSEATWRSQGSTDEESSAKRLPRPFGPRNDKVGIGGWLRGSCFHCHREERSDVAISGKYRQGKQCQEIATALQASQ